MKTIAAAITASTAVLMLASPIVGAQSWKPPAESERCPSKWGAGDERGSANHMKPASVLAAAQLIRAGEVIELGHVLRAGMPIQATRQYNLHTKRTFMNPQSNQRGSNEELVVTELGQVGTQFDGFAHQSHGDSLYNCFKTSDIASRTGFTKLGIEKVGTLMTRGVLIDVAGLKGVDTLPDAYEIATWTNLTSATGAGDSDGDGMTNAQEFRAGTNPRDPLSLFRLAPPATVGADKPLSLANFAGRTCRIDFTDLLGSPTPWRILADQIPGTGSNIIIISDPGAAALPQRFYRAVVLP